MSNKNTFRGFITEINENKANNKDFDKFQYNKLNYLNEVYDNLKTIEVYWGIFQRFIHFQEVNKDKDLFLFDDYEIRELLISAPTNSRRTKRLVWTAIEQYMAWAISREYRLDSNNPCDYIDINEMLKVNKKALAKKIYSLDEIYEYAVKAERKGNTSQEILLMLLARYGVVGKEASWLINLKHEDIDFNNNVVRIYEDEKLISELDFDDRLKGWVEKAANEKSFKVSGKNGSTREINYYDNGYVFKSTKVDAEKIEKMVVYGYMGRICSNLEINKISLTDLLRSRKFDLLDEIKESNGGKLTIDDFKSVSDKFNPKSSYSTYTTLLNDYKLLTDVEIDRK